MTEQVAAATFKHQKKSIAPEYLPFVGILEIPNVTASNFSKFEWNWKVPHAELLLLADLAGQYPDLVPQDLFGKGKKGDEGEKGKKRDFF